MLNLILNAMRFVKTSKKGQGMVEYALIIGVIAVALIATLGLVGDEIVGIFTNIIAELQGA